MDFGQNTDQQVQFMQGVLASPQMMQQAFNGFMTQMMPQMMPQLMQMFAKQMQQNLNQMTNSQSNAQPTIPPNFPKAQKNLANIAKMTPKNSQSTTQSSSQKAPTNPSKPPKKVQKQSAYNLYTKSRFSEIKAANPTWAMGEISKQVSAEYKELSNEKK